MDSAATPQESNYTVVARRYRPRSFDQLIGQDHVAHALGTAISTGRVGHAYLFTGARGVGKTSTARIFAKALNAGEGVSAELVEEISQAIDAGEDMDVIEIDGASNRGIEEIRQLRANVNVRPSRSRYKIYIIDEVHMLTNQAFNALLKTLEEPPGHVKFIFCTTDPDKIPITVLSRCQRFDFAPVKLEAIQARLKEISIAEGYQVEDDALALLARRAAGSMRDSQSLLEQVMSFAEGTISVEQVHSLLGTADEGRLLEIVELLRNAQALEAISAADVAIRGGADPGQLAEQLLNYLRDLMAVGIGGSAELLKLANPANHGTLADIAKAWGVSAILSAIQIMDESLVRMRSSVSAATLLEVALVQICQLEQLASIPELLASLSGQNASAPASRPRQNAAAAPVASTQKKNAEPVAAQASASPAASPVREINQTVGNGALPPAAEPPSHPSNAAPEPSAAPQTSVPVAEAPPTTAQPKTAPAAAQPPTASGKPAAPRATQSIDTGKSSPEAFKAWIAAVSSIDGMLADFASMAVAVEPDGSDKWDVVFPPGSTTSSDYCNQRRPQLLSAVEASLGRPIQLNFRVIPGEAPTVKAAPPKSSIRAQKMREVAANPYIKRLIETLDGEIVRVDPAAATNTAPRNSAPVAASS